MFARAKDMFRMKPNLQVANSQKHEILWHMDRIASMYSWTPDAIQMEKRLYQPVFVYDNMAKGGNEHYLIEGAFLDKDENGASHNYTVFTKDLYELWKFKLGENTYPIALQTGSPPATLACAANIGSKVKSARIKGKLYKVRSDIMYMLDSARHNGVMFHRKKIDILVPYRMLNGCRLGFSVLTEEDVEPRQAWMYIAEPDYWSPLLDGGCYFTPAELLSMRPKKWTNDQSMPAYFYDPNREALNHK